MKQTIVLVKYPLILMTNTCKFGCYAPTVIKLEAVRIKGSFSDKRFNCKFFYSQKVVMKSVVLLLVVMQVKFAWFLLSNGLTGHFISSKYWSYHRLHMVMVVAVVPTVSIGQENPSLMHQTLKWHFNKHRWKENQF